MGDGVSCQVLDVVEQDEGGEVHLPPGLAFRWRDELLELPEDRCAQGIENQLDDDLVELCIYYRRDGNLAVVRAGLVRDRGDAERVGSAHLPRNLNHTRDGPETEGVGN
jgi:hypothetical protein